MRPARLAVEITPRNHDFGPSIRLRANGVNAAGHGLEAKSPIFSPLVTGCNGWARDDGIGKPERLRAGYLLGKNTHAPASWSGRVEGFAPVVAAAKVPLRAGHHRNRTEVLLTMPGDTSTRELAGVPAEKSEV